MANSSTTDNPKQVTSDDQELAKTLAGVTQEADDIKNNEAASPVAPTNGPIGSNPGFLTPPTLDPSANMAPAAIPMPNMSAPAAPSAGQTVDPALASVKQAALTELRPLIGKLDVEPEEKFNTYLLLIRSTDDKELIAPAHEAAKAIPDEAKKAQALLDIIKEIDFLSGPQK